MHQPHSYAMPSSNRPSASSGSQHWPHAPCASCHRARCVCMTLQASCHNRPGSCTAAVLTHTSCIGCCDACQGAVHAGTRCNPFDNAMQIEKSLPAHVGSGARLRNACRVKGRVSECLGSSQGPRNSACNKRCSPHWCRPCCDGGSFMVSGNSHGLAGAAQTAATSNANATCTSGPHMLIWFKLCGPQVTWPVQASHWQQRTTCASVAAASAAALRPGERYHPSRVQHMTKTSTCCPGCSIMHGVCAFSGSNLIDAKMQNTQARRYGKFFKDK
jgi:hypothetical protein